MALQSPTSSDPSDESTARHEPPAEMPAAEPEVTAAANGSGCEATAADPGSSSAGGEGARTHRRGLSPALWAFLGVIGAAIIGVIGTIIVAEIQRQSSAPPSPPPTHSVTPAPTPTFSSSPSPSPSPTPSPRPSPSPPPTASTAAPPAALIDPNAHYLIENADTGTCLSWAWGSSTSAGPSPCVYRADTDAWRYLAQPNGTFELQNKVNNLCLGEANVNGGVPVVATCNAAPGQQWRRRYARGQDVSVINEESGLCLAATGPGDSGSIPLQSCNQQPNQLWHNDGTL